MQRGVYINGVHMNQARLCNFKFIEAETAPAKLIIHGSSNSGIQRFHEQRAPQVFRAREPRSDRRYLFFCSSKIQETFCSTERVAVKTKELRRPIQALTQVHSQVHRLLRRICLVCGAGRSRVLNTCPRIPSLNPSPFPILASPVTGVVPIRNRATGE